MLDFGSGRAVMPAWPAPPTAPADRETLRVDSRSRSTSLCQPWDHGHADWCRDNVQLGWEQHGFMDKKRRDAQGIPIDYTHWYFVSEADAAAFRERWRELLD